MSEPTFQARVKANCGCRFDKVEAFTEGTPSLITEAFNRCMIASLQHSATTGHITELSVSIRPNQRPQVSA